MKGYDFHRQKPMDNYIVDFFCPELILALEIDGISHEGKEKDIYDKERQKRLESFGISFLRFRDIDVKKNLEGVLMEIEKWIDKHNPPLTPPKRGINYHITPPKRGINYHITSPKRGIKSTIPPKRGNNPIYNSFKIQN